MKKLLSIFFICFLFLFAAQGQINVVKIDEGMDLGDKQGFYYSLPSTLVKVEVDVSKVAYKTGPYATYAQEYLGLTDVTTSDYNVYSIQNATISSIAIPDPLQLYFVEIQGKLTKENKAVLFALSESGLASGVSADIPLDQALKGSVFYKDGNSGKNDFGYFASSNRYEQIDTIIQKVLVDTTLIEKVHLDRRWMEKADEQKAVDAANKVTQIREARYNLLSGYQEIAYDAGTIAYMDKQLETMEQEYLSLFIGVSHTVKLYFTFYVNPDPSASSQKIAVFNFSERGGVKPLSGAGGEVVFLQMKKLSTPGTLTTVLDGRESKITGDHGFYYRLPVATRFTLDYSGGETASAIFPVNQFGSVVSLPPSVINVEFHPKTGTIKRMLVE